MSIVLNLIIPMSYFIGVMGTDSARSDAEMWQGFLFVQGIPLLLLLTSIVIIVLRKKIKRKRLKTGATI